MRSLRRAGVLRSQRGVKGGYSFAREAGRITVLEIVELLDGPVGADAKGVFGEAAAAAREVLERPPSPTSSSARRATAGVGCTTSDDARRQVFGTRHRRHGVEAHHAARRRRVERGGHRRITLHEAGHR